MTDYTINPTENPQNSHALPGPENPPLKIF
jgi:hypothetical protein